MSTPKRLTKAEWGPGPWQDEPDEHTWEHAGLECRMIRHMECGHWCGYVILPGDHPDVGKSYGDINVEVHGGLTFGARMDGATPNAWGVGFDCAHAFDYSPGIRALLRRVGSTRNASEFETYRTLEWVIAETNQLAEQLAARLPPKGGETA